MSFTRAVLAAFIGGILATVALLAYRLSHETGKSMPAVFAEIPGEAQEVFGQVRTRTAEAVKNGKETFRQKQDTVMEYVRVTRQPIEGTEK